VAAQTMHHACPAHSSDHHSRRYSVAVLQAILRQKVELVKAIGCIVYLDSEAANLVVMELEADLVVEAACCCKTALQVLDQAEERTRRSCMKVVAAVSDSALLRWLHSLKVMGKSISMSQT
jgi:hypothetical protein